MNTNQSTDRDPVTGSDALEQFAAAAGDARRLALDTEFLRVRTYYPQLCLLQLATARDRVACIDPLALDQDLIGGVLRSFRGELVVHAAGQDLEVLDSVLGYRPDRLFDTQIAASMLGIGEQVSYAALVRERLGVSLDKLETRTDWCRRPLTPAQLQYARDDVAYLCELAEGLYTELQQGGKSDWFEDECRQLVLSTDDDSGIVERFKGGATVDPEWQPLLRELVLFREAEARRADLPREWVLRGPDLVAIARTRPADSAALAAATEMKPGQLRRLADSILQIVGSTAPEPGAEPIWESREPPDPVARGRLKRLQAEVRRIAAGNSISATLLASRSDLQKWLRGRPSRLDGGWRREILDDLLAREAGE